MGFDTEIFAEVWAGDRWETVEGLRVGILSCDVGIDLVYASRGAAYDLSSAMMELHEVSGGSFVWFPLEGSDRLVDGQDWAEFVGLVKWEVGPRPTRLIVWRGN